MRKINKILISQPQPEGLKSPYFDIANKYNLDVVFRPFIKVEGIPFSEFIKQKIEFADYTSIVFFARTGVDNFFRLAKSSKYKISPELKYFCINEAMAFYMQKYVKFRKRKIFSTTSSSIEDLIAMLTKQKNDKFLLVLPEEDINKIDILLEKTDLKYNKASMYRSVKNKFTRSEKFDYDMMIFFSPHGIHSLKESFPKFEQKDIYIGCLGATTAQSIKDAGFRVDLEVPNPQFSSMTLALEDFIQINQKGSKK